MSKTSYKTFKHPVQQFAIKPLETDEIKKTLINQLLPYLRGDALLCGSGAISIYQNQTGIGKDTSYKYFDFEYINLKTKGVIKTCQRDLDIITYDVCSIKKYLSTYGTLTDSRPSGKYSTLLNSRGIESIERVTLKIFDFPTLVGSSRANLMEMLIKKAYPWFTFCELHVDIVALIPSTIGTVLQSRFKELSAEWPISNLMRNFYFAIDNEGQLIPKMFSKPSYFLNTSPLTQIGLIDMIEVLKMYCYYYDNVLPYTSSTGDFYKPLEDKKRYYKLDYTKSHQKILNMALLTHFNPIININLSKIGLPYIMFDPEKTTVDVIMKKFKYPIKIAKQAHASIKEGHMCFCMDEFSTKTPLFITKCGHVMHLSCFAKYYMEKIIYRMNLMNRIDPTVTIQSSSNNHQCPYCREKYDDLPPKPHSMALNTNYFNHQDQMYTVEEVIKSTPFVI